MSEFGIYLIVALLVILSAWVPLFVGSLPFSLPMIGLGIGCLVPLLTSTGDPYGEHTPVMLHITEFALLVSVFGAGLKLDRRFSLRGWSSTWRMLGLVMPIFVGLATAVGHWLLGLPLGLALLLAAMIAPTDPVMASGFGAGPPGHGEEGETKFALTSEAGLNDGLAFPFVVLGLELSGAQSDFGLGSWAVVDLIWNVCGGVAIGGGVGWLLVMVNRLLPDPVRLSASNSGLVAVGLALFVYAIATALDCNGFVAVFCEAVAIRNFTGRYEYSQTLNHAAEQFERLAMVCALALLGVSISQGQFGDAGIADVGYAVIILVVLRPVSVVLGCIGSGKDIWTRAALGCFGIRGLHRSITSNSLARDSRPIRRHG